MEEEGGGSSAREGWRMGGERGVSGVRREEV